MGGDREPERVRLVDDSAQFLQSELAGQYVGADGHRTPARHDLHDVGTAVGPVPYRPS